ncbi:MAG: double zinc ribbon domain-containing protein [Limisphaerales bacterium]
MNPLAVSLGSWEALLSLLFPDVCQLCGGGRATAVEGYVCGRCVSGAGNVRWIRPPFCSRCGIPFDGEISTEFVCGNCLGLDLAFGWARASVVATPFLLDVIHRYKYGRRLYFGPFLAGLLARAAAPVLAGGGWDGLVPVPLHPAREREREFNQAERLGRSLGAVAGIPLEAGLVRRIGATRVQASLDRRERVRNVSGAFQVTDGARVAGRRWVVVDDVLTTGATTSAVAGALRAAGAREVVVWTLARGT